MTQFAQLPRSTILRPANVSVQRRCACGGEAGSGGECAACAARRKALQRSAASGAAPASPPGAAASIGQRSGTPIEPGLRGAMERRLTGAAQRTGIEPITRSGSLDPDAPGARFERNAEAVSRARLPEPGEAARFDFSHVRIHDDAAADHSARAIDANAYTVGSHIAFRANRFNPQTPAGSDLLAHELTHVVQQSGGAKSIQRQEVGDRRVTYDEHVDQTRHKPSDPNSVWKGEMTRTRSLEEYSRIPRKGKTPAHEGWKTIRTNDWDVNLEFDPSKCAVRIPSRFTFNNPSFKAPARWDPCDFDKPNSTPRQPLDASVFSSLRADFISQMNSGLNGWYSAKIEGCSKGPCAGKTIPIVVDAHDGGAKEARSDDVDLINAFGRSCVRSDGMHIYAPSGKRKPRMWVHEGGHLLLGVGDEYVEEGRPDEFVADDYSLMGDAEMTRFASLHERHFAFVPVFLDEVLEGMGHPGCSATLVELRRPLARSVAVTLGGGGASFARGSGQYLDLGVDVGWADSRDRAVEKIAGIHAKLLSEEGDEISNAFLVGARFALQRRFGGSGHALVLGGFAEAGAGQFDLGTDKSTLGAYGEIGGYLDYRPAQRKEAPGIRLEGALGGRLGTAGQIGETPPGSPSPGGPMEYWTRLGVSVVFPF